MGKLAIGLGFAALIIGVALFSLAEPRREKIRKAPLLPMNFAHEDHVAQACLDCHHNYADNSGNLPCVECHKTDPAVNLLIETHFHDYCRGCHIEQQLLGEDSGPVRECYACHQVDERP